ncbi:MAG TPA: hypothetical protein VIX19_19590 [Terriglobales bacterium]
MSGGSSPLPSAAPLAVLDASPYACFVLSESLDITYCNVAWDRFAREQGGTAAVMARNIVGKNLLDFVPTDLKSFYREMIDRVRAQGRPIGHDYECSSASVFRLYHLQVYPLKSGSGFVVENSLRVEHPHDRVAREPHDALYSDTNGFIVCCANCRRTRRATDPTIWDWVPAYLESKLLNISHGVCPLCLEFYYRPVIKTWAA